MSNKLFDRDQITILEKGIKSLSIACDSLTKLNKQLTEEVEKLCEENKELKKSEKILRDKL